MAKVNQNKLIGGLIVAVVTLLVVIVIVLIAQSFFPSNGKNTQSTVLGTGTNQTYTAASTVTTPAPATGSSAQTTPQGTQEEPGLTTPAATDTASGMTVYLNTSVYLRSEASWQGAKGSVIKKGSSAKVLSVDKDWYRLEYNGEQGYVYKDYISDSPISAQQTAATAVVTTAAPEPSV